MWVYIRCTLHFTPVYHNATRARFPGGEEEAEVRAKTVKEQWSGLSYLNSGNVTCNLLLFSFGARFVSETHKKYFLFWFVYMMPSHMWVSEIWFDRSLFSSRFNKHYIGNSEWVNEGTVLNTAVVGWILYMRLYFSPAEDSDTSGLLHQVVTCHTGRSLAQDGP